MKLLKVYQGRLAWFLTSMGMRIVRHGPLIRSRPGSCMQATLGRKGEMGWTRDMGAITDLARLLSPSTRSLGFPASLASSNVQRSEDPEIIHPPLRLIPSSSL